MKLDESQPEERKKSGYHGKVLIIMMTLVYIRIQDTLQKLRARLVTGLNLHKEANAFMLEMSDKSLDLILNPLLILYYVGHLMVLSVEMNAPLKLAVQQLLLSLHPMLIFLSSIWLVIQILKILKKT